MGWYTDPGNSDPENTTWRKINVSEQLDGLTALEKGLVVYKPVSQLKVGDWAVTMTYDKATRERTEPTIVQVTSVDRRTVLAGGILFSRTTFASHDYKKLLLPATEALVRMAKLHMMGLVRVGDTQDKSHYSVALEALARGEVKDIPLAKVKVWDWVVLADLTEALVRYSIVTVQRATKVHIEADDKLFRRADGVHVNAKHQPSNSYHLFPATEGYVRHAKNCMMGVSRNADETEAEEPIVETIEIEVDHTGRDRESRAIRAAKWLSDQSPDVIQVMVGNDVLFGIASWLEQKGVWE